MNKELYNSIRERIINLQKEMKDKISSRGYGYQSQLSDILNDYIKKGIVEHDWSHSDLMFVWNHVITEGLKV